MRLLARPFAVAIPRAILSRRTPGSTDVRREVARPTRTGTGCSREGTGASQARRDPADRRRGAGTTGRGDASTARGLSCRDDGGHQPKALYLADELLSGHPVHVVVHRVIVADAPNVSTERRRSRATSRARSAYSRLSVGRGPERARAHRWWPRNRRACAADGDLQTESHHASGGVSEAAAASVRRRRIESQPASVRSRSCISHAWSSTW